MSHELFAEISVEQQQLVSGGGGYYDPGVTDDASTYFKAEKTVTTFDFALQSNADGSKIGQLFKTDETEVDTAAKKYFTFFDK
jgi:hypothetical protein